MSHKVYIFWMNRKSFHLLHRTFSKSVITINIYKTLVWGSLFNCLYISRTISNCLGIYKMVIEFLNLFCIYLSFALPIEKNVKFMLKLLNAFWIPLTYCIERKIINWKKIYAQTLIFWSVVASKQIQSSLSQRILEFAKI